jgi:hypothetical protein
MQRSKSANTLSTLTRLEPAIEKVEREHILYAVDALMKTLSLKLFQNEIAAFCEAFSLF